MQIYKKENFIVVPVCNDFLVINTDKVFKEGHTYVKSFNVSKMLINFAINKQLPKNPYFVDNLIRISNNLEYINRLQQFKEDGFINYKDLMSAPSYRRVNGALRQVK